jgi:glycosyltransferase involved in cell wall biosynthesis
MSGPFDIAAARNLANICDELGIGVVHTNYLRENYISILAKTFFNRNIRVVYTNHYVVGNNLPVRLANRIMTRADHRIIAVCDAGAPRLIKNGNARKKIIVIHNAVDPLAWRPGADYHAVRARVREKYGIGGDEKVFFCASRFADDKGHRFLINSLTKLSAEYGARGLRVLLAGDGPLEAEIKALAKDRGLSETVDFIGYINDIKPLFYAADAYINPSRHEAFSFLILEALASGLPVIAADMGGNREIVNDANGCGTLLNYGDEEALRDAIQSYRTDGAGLENKKANALRTIAEKFSLDEMLAKTFASFY